MLRRLKLAFCSVALTILAGCPSTPQIDVPRPVARLDAARVSDHLHKAEWTVTDGLDLNRLYQQVTDVNAEWVPQTVVYRTADIEIRFQYSDGAVSHYILINNQVHDRIYMRSLSRPTYQDLLLLVRQTKPRSG